MTLPAEPSHFDRKDYIIASLIGLGALVVYIRTLAPDLLFGDSAEFQALAYSPAYTHSTGYPIYLLIARTLGFLPIRSFAWRVNFLSALFAAGTIFGIYFLIRKLSRNRIGAILGCLSLGISYTFWSQAVIAEIYTTATIFIVTIVFFAWHWYEDPQSRSLWLFFSLMLAGTGIHTTVVLIAPAIGVFIIWTLWKYHASIGIWKRSLLAAVLGGLAGVSIFLLGFLILDINNPPTSFIQVTLYPSRSLWGATAADLDTFLERVYATVVSIQWRGAMFSGGVDFAIDSFKSYWQWLLGHDFTILMLLLSLVGFFAILRSKPIHGGFMLIAIGTLLFFIANYNTSDRQVFYLATYIFLAVAIGAGIGYILDKIQQALGIRSATLSKAVYTSTAILLTLVILLPTASVRWDALRAGSTNFVTEDYAYPIYDLSEPRRIAEERMLCLPDDALLVLDWRTLYATYYLSYVEQGRKGLQIYEASPYPSNWALPETLLEEVKAAVQSGRLVYSDQEYSNLRPIFRLIPVTACNLFRLSIP